MNVESRLYLVAGTVEGISRQIQKLVQPSYFHRRGVRPEEKEVALKMVRELREYSEQISALVEVLESS